MTPDHVEAHPWPTFWAASGAVFLVSLDATIAVAAFPALRAEFPAATPALLSWTLNSYTILYAALLVPSGRLADLFGRKRLFLTGIAIFTVASAMCGLAIDPYTLIISRAGQAVGGALLTPSSLALVLGAFPPNKRAATVGLWSAVGALAAALGPAAGAALIEASSWRAAFLINLPVGLALIWLAKRNLIESRSPELGAPLDGPGIALLAAGAGALALAIVQSEAWGFADERISIAALSGAALLAGYAVWARGRANAALDLSLFADRTYAFASLATLMFGVAFSIMFLSAYLFMIEIWNFSPPMAGLALMPGPLMVIPASILAGRLAGQIGHRPLIVAGGVLYALAQVLVIARAGDEPAYWTVWFPSQLASGLAIGLMLSSLAGAAVARLPASRFGVGGAVNNAIRQLGGVFGAAIAVALVGAVGPDLARFQASFMTMATLGLVVAGLALPIDTRPDR